MMSSASRFGGISAIVVGALSILYAVFYLLIKPQAPALGSMGSAIILASSGFFTAAAYVALDARVRAAHPEQARWALILGAGASIATLLHGIYGALLFNAVSSAADPAVRATLMAMQQAPSPVNPGGLAAFGVVGVVGAAYSWLILRSGALPRALGYLGLVNAALLLTLFFANVAGVTALVLLSGGLTSVIVGPIWWVMLGLRLLRDAQPAPRLQAATGLSS
jgi:hypothetical protein